MLNPLRESSDVKQETDGRKDGLWRTENGRRFEELVRDIFKLKKSKLYSLVRPDIFDPGKGIIGEVKSVFAGEKRVTLYTDQIKKYLEFADYLGKQTLLDKEITKMSVFYFIVAYDEKGSLEKIYVLDKETLENLLGFDEEKTKWRLPNNPRLQKRVDVLDDKTQTFLSVRRGASKQKRDRGNLRDDALDKNKKGAYVRLNFAELDVLCSASSRKGYDGKRVRIQRPASLSVPELGLGKAHCVANAEPLGIPLSSRPTARKVLVKA